MAGGAAFGLLNGFLIFRWGIFQPGQPAFDCVTVGTMLAAMLMLVRASLRASAAALAISYGVLSLFFALYDRWIAGISGLLLALGVLLVAVIYDELARYGLRFGKFLIVGPLLGGVYLALAPVTELRDMTMFNAVRPMLFQLALGVVIGEGVGLGVELAELLPWATARRASG